MEVGIDIAEYAGNNFLILVDYFSKWLEVEILKNKTLAECIIKLKKKIQYSWDTKNIGCR